MRVLLAVALLLALASCSSSGDSSGAGDNEAGSGSGTAPVADNPDNDGNPEGAQGTDQRPDPTPEANPGTGTDPGTDSNPGTDPQANPPEDPELPGNTIEGSLFTVENYLVLLARFFPIANAEPLLDHAVFMERLQKAKEVGGDPAFELTNVDEVSTAGSVATFQYACSAGGSVEMQVDTQDDGVPALDADNYVYEWQATDCTVDNLRFSGRVTEGNVVLGGQYRTGRFDQFLVENLDTAASKALSGKLDIGWGDTYRYGSQWYDIDFTYGSEALNYTLQGDSIQTGSAPSVFAVRFDVAAGGDLMNGEAVTIVTTDEIRADAENAVDGRYYYASGRVELNGEAGNQLVIEPGNGNLDTFQATLAHEGSITAFEVPWSEQYYFRCSDGLPTFEPQVKC